MEPLLGLILPFDGCGEALPVIPDLWEEEEAASTLIGGAIGTTDLTMPQLVNSTGEWQTDGVGDLLG